MQKRTIHVEGIGPFVIPAEPEARSVDSELTVRTICGRHDPELARSEGAWGSRVGQEYSYLARPRAEDVRTIIDIGCNVGAFIVWATRIWWPATVERVFAYDPNKLCTTLAERNLALVQRGIEVKIFQAAISVDPKPLFLEDVRLGCSRTHGTTQGVPVKAFHPRDLPAADCIKTDAEGVDADVFEHYRHWAGVKVALFEWHEHEHRERMFAICHGAGLILRKNDCGQDSQGVACFVRPS